MKTTIIIPITADINNYDIVNYSLQNTIINLSLRCIKVHLQSLKSNAACKLRPGSIGIRVSIRAHAGRLAIIGRLLPHNVAAVSFRAQPEVLVAGPVLTQLLGIGVQTVSSLIVLTPRRRCKSCSDFEHLVRFD